MASRAEVAVIVCSAKSGIGGVLNLRKCATHITSLPTVRSIEGIDAIDPDFYFSDPIRRYRPSSDIAHTCMDFTGYRLLKRHSLDVRLRRRHCVTRAGFRTLPCLVCRRYGKGVSRTVGQSVYATGRYRTRTLQHARSTACSVKTDFPTAIISWRRKADSRTAITGNS